MDIATCMKRNVFSVPATATIGDAAAVFVKRHIGMLPVVDRKGKPVGVVSLPDMMTLALPDFVKFIDDLDFVQDFGAVEATRPTAAMMGHSIKTLMRPPIAVLEDCGLLRAYALMLQHRLHDMLVLSAAGKLVGIASRVDIGTAILKSWARPESK
jgi:DHA2 family multidrug resistance protein-like MFS transporter